MAGPVEETVKLLPLLLVGAVAWNRVRRFGVADFLVLGAATGAGFQLAEDLLRRLAQRPGFIDAMLMDGDEFTDYHVLSLFPGWADYDGMEFSGHAVSSGLIGAGIGLAVVLAGRGGAWRLVWLVPPLVLVWVTAGHMAFNDEAGLGSAGLLPEALHRLHETLGSGHANRYVLLALLVLAVAVDWQAMRRVSAQVPALVPSASWQPWAEIRVLWSGLRRGPRSYLQALLLVRSHRELALGAARAQGRPRYDGEVRGRVAGLLAVFAPMPAAGAVVAIAALVSGAWPGRSPSGEAAYLAALFDDLAQWWEQLGPVGQVMVIAGAVGALTMVGMGVLPATLFALNLTAIPDSGRGIADFLRNPGRAISDFVSSRSPADLIWTIPALVFSARIPVAVRNQVTRFALRWDERAWRSSLPYEPIGTWQKRARSLKHPYSTNYEQWIRGRTGGSVRHEYTVNGVDFDGTETVIRNGQPVEALIEVKGKYGWMLRNDGTWRWEKVPERMLAQMERQVRAAQGRPVRWYFLEERVADEMRILVEENERLAGRVEVIWQPMDEGL